MRAVIVLHFHLHAHFQFFITLKRIERHFFQMMEREFDRAARYNVPLNWESLGKRCHLVENDREFARGVKLITLPGHSYGVLGLVVETKNDGVLIFPSDAIYTKANYGPPAKLPGIVYDTLSFFESIEKARRLAAKHNAKVMFPHDMEFFKTLKLAPQCYE